MFAATQRASGSMVPSSYQRYENAPRDCATLLPVRKAYGVFGWVSRWMRAFPATLRADEASDVGSPLAPAVTSAALSWGRRRASATGSDTTASTSGSVVANAATRRLSAPTVTVEPS